MLDFLNWNKFFKKCDNYGIDIWSGLVSMGESWDGYLDLD